MYAKGLEFKPTLSHCTLVVVWGWAPWREGEGRTRGPRAGGGGRKGVNLGPGVHSPEQGRMGGEVKTSYSEGKSEHTPRR